MPRLEQRAAVAAAVRSVFNCPDRPHAERRLKAIVADYATAAPKLAAWMEENLPQGFTVFALPAGHQRRLRTTNALERVNMELKRRTRASALPNSTRRRRWKAAEDGRTPRRCAFLRAPV